jgi:hypothetical protein
MERGEIASIAAASRMLTASFTAASSCPGLTFGRRRSLGHKVIPMTVRYAHLAPKHALAAAERLNSSAERSTDTTIDTGVLQAVRNADGGVAVTLFIG